MQHRYTEEQEELMPEVIHQERTKRQSFTYASEFLEMLEEAPLPERVYIHLQAADQSLVLTSLLRGHLTRRRRSLSVGFYQKFGQDNYYQASQSPIAKQLGMSGLLEGVARSLPKVVRTLNEVQQEWLYINTEPVD